MILPLNFEHLSGDKYFISNLSGFNSIVSRSDLLNLINDPDKIGSDIYSELERKLFISNDETSLIITQSSLEKKILSQISFNPIYMIIPTLRCDHDCTYCQVSRAKINDKNSDLDESKISLIIDKIKNMSSPPYKIEIQGGEALIRIDLIKKIYQECLEKIGFSNFEFVITTSLSNCDDDFLTWIDKGNVYISTSIDGDELVHNSNRILHSASSFKKVSEAILKIQRLYGQGKVSAVTTVTKELLKNAKSLVDVCKKLNLNEIFVRPISPYGFAKNNNITYEQNEYMYFYRELIDRIIEENRKGYRIVEYSFLIHFNRVFNPRYNSYADLKSPSGLFFNSVVFNHDGRMYASDESRMLSRVNNKLDLSLDIKNDNFHQNDLYLNMISNSFNLVHPGCNECAFQMYCGADPCQNISVFGEPVGNKSTSSFCKYHKSMFKLMLDKVQEDDVFNLIYDWAING